MNLDKAIDLIISNGSTGNSIMSIKRADSGNVIWSGKTVDFIMQLEEWRNANMEICSTVNEKNGNASIYVGLI